MKAKIMIAAAALAIGLSYNYEVFAERHIVNTKALIRTEILGNNATIDENLLTTARMAAAKKALDKYIVIGDVDPVLYGKILNQYDLYTDDKLEVVNGNIAVPVNLLIIADLVKHGGVLGAIDLGNKKPETLATYPQVPVQNSDDTKDKNAIKEEINADVAVLVRMIGFKEKPFKHACREIINENMSQVLGDCGFKVLEPKKMEQVHQLEANGDDLPYSVYKEEGLAGVYDKTGAKLAIVGEVELVKFEKENGEFVARMKGTLEFVERQDISYVTLDRYDEILTVRNADKLSALEILTDMLVVRAGKKFGVLGYK